MSSYVQLQIDQWAVSGHSLEFVQDFPWCLKAHILQACLWYIWLFSKLYYFAKNTSDCQTKQYASVLAIKMIQVE